MEGQFLKLDTGILSRRQPRASTIRCAKIRIMRKDPIPDKVVRAVHLDVPDLLAAGGFYGDDLVPEDGAFTISPGRA